MKCYTVRGSTLDSHIATTTLQQYGRCVISVGDFYVASPTHGYKLIDIPDQRGFEQTVLVRIDLSYNCKILFPAKSDLQWRRTAEELLKTLKVKTWKNPEDPEETDIFKDFFEVIVAHKNQALVFIRPGHSFEVTCEDTYRFTNVNGVLIRSRPLQEACTALLSEVWDKVYRR